MYEVLYQRFVTMKCSIILVTVFVMSVNTAPYITESGHWMPNQQLDQQMLNQIAEQSMEQWILKNQYNSMQQQMMAMPNFQGMKKVQYGTVPTLFNLPRQPLILIVPSTIAKTTNRIENLNEKPEADFKHGIGDADTVVISSENESYGPEINMVPQRVVVLPNGQRMIIGSIISAIPFLPFEVNVPDTIGWIYNGIAGIIGGIGQRLPFRPKPTTEKPVQQSQESMPSAQESMAPVQESIIIPPETEILSTQNTGINLIQKLLPRMPNMGMPILMFPMAQAVPIQVPIQV